MKFAPVKVPVAKSTAKPIYFPHKPAAAGVTPAYAGSSTPYGKTPAVVRGAYGMNAVTFGGITGDGTGQTIAIVDAYDFPTAASDLNAFSSYFGLPTLISNTNTATINNASGPTFTKVSQTGSTTSLPSTDPAGPYSTTGGGTWEQEEALDIEWAHVMAPKANIVLVEATSASYANLLQAGVNWARSQPGIDVVSMSFGGNEFSGETSYDAYFTTPSGHLGGAATAGGSFLTGGVTFLASSGDSGAYASGTTTITPQYPAASPNIVAVGGTNLQTSGTSYVSESAWGNSTTSGTAGGGGGGISAYESLPSYQASTVSAFSTTKRTYPDVAVLADPNTGVPIYDSWDFTAAAPWIPGYEGGTSLACPLMAGVTAVADQGRALSGIGSLYGSQSGTGTAAGALQNVYSIPSADYHDITSGSNGYSAAAGYDLATGRGSPVGAAFVKDLAALPSTYTASGTVFTDKNGNGAFDGTDTALAGVTVYADVNANGAYDSGTDVATTSTATGTFTLSGVSTGTAIREVLPANYVAVTSTTAGTVSGANLTGLSLANFPTAFTAAAATNFTLRLDPTGTTEQIFVNTATGSTPTYQIAKSKLTGILTFTGSAGDDVFNADGIYGNPLAAGVFFNGGAQTSADRVTVTAPTAGTVVGFSNTSVNIAASTLSYTNAEALGFTGTVANDNVSVANNTLPFSYVGGGGSDGLAIASGGTFAPTADLGADGTTVNLLTTGSTAVTFNTNQTLGSLYLQNSSTATLGGSNLVLRATALNVTGTAALNLGTGAMILDYAGASPLTTLAGYLATGYAAGAWTGAGVRSSAAAANPGYAVGFGEASAALGLTGAATGTFLGQSVDATTLLIRYTRSGDANLDGTVNFNDFLTLQADFGGTTPGFTAGDFTYDSKTDFNDFLLLQAQFGSVA